VLKPKCPNAPIPCPIWPSESGYVCYFYLSIPVVAAVAILVVIVGVVLVDFFLLS
jgi:hypothetical protein